MRPLHRTFIAAVVLSLIGRAGAAPNFTRNILLTGYWPPTNNMLRDYSPLASSNPGGWQGANWRGTGFNVISYFPEFPGQTGPNWGRGSGDMEVDYQDTWDDWQRITAATNPVAIITFSRANTSVGWELEPAAQRFRVSGEANPPGRNVPFYVTDGFDNNGAAAPNMNFPTAAGFLFEPVGTIRNNTLPMQRIVDTVAAGMTGAQADPFIAPYDPGNPSLYDFGGSFLSGYASYLGTWYGATHAGPDATFRTFAAGHIHVGQNMTLANAEAALDLTLEALVGYLREVMPSTTGPLLPGGELSPSALGGGAVAVPGAGTAGAVMVLGVLGAGRRRRLVRSI